MRQSTVAYQERGKINLSVITLEGGEHDEQIKCKYFYIFLLYIKKEKNMKVGRIAILPTTPPLGS